MKIRRKSLSKICLFILISSSIIFTIILTYIGYSTNETFNESIDLNQTNITIEENETIDMSNTTNITTNIELENITTFDTIIDTNLTTGTTLENKTIEIQIVPEIEGKVKDTENNTVGKKIEDDPYYETFFTFVGKENNSFIVKFYHNASASLPVWIEANIDYNLTASIADPSTEIILTVPLMNGKIPKFKLHIGNYSDVFEFGITIITVQSYPTVGGNWTVEFNTTGIADLTIRAVDGTEFGRDIKFLEIKCGDSILTTELNDLKKRGVEIIAIRELLEVVKEKLNTARDEIQAKNFGSASELIYDAETIVKTVEEAIETGPFKTISLNMIIIWILLTVVLILFIGRILLYLLHLKDRKMGIKLKIFDKEAEKITKEHNKLEKMLKKMQQKSKE